MDAGWSRWTLALVSGGLTLAISVACLRTVQRHWARKPRRHGYGIAFVDSSGRHISRQQGRVQLMLDPLCLFRLRPDQNDPQFHVDATGCRPTRESVDDGLPKVAILGGSTAFGYLAPSDSATFPWRLAERFRDFEFINAGCPGHLSGQELAMMVHYVDERRPVAYVVFDGWNEVVDQDAGQPRFATQFGFNNAFFMMEERLFVHHRAVDPRNKRVDLPIQRGPRPKVDDETYQRAIASNYVANLAKMHAFAGARAARLLVVLQPELTAKKAKTESEQQILAMWDKTGYRSRGLPEKYRDLVRRAATDCRRLGIPCVNLRDDLAFTEANEELFCDPVHLNERGHAVVADRLAVKIEELLRTTASAQKAQRGERAIR